MWRLDDLQAMTPLGLTPRQAHSACSSAKLPQQASHT
jgi:hypothetical protein